MHDAGDMASLKLKKKETEFFDKYSKIIDIYRYFSNRNEALVRNHLLPSLIF